jgi:peptidoglycan/xylan/chitin deacetylase (PgdA/CDA1 family)
MGSASLLSRVQGYWMRNAAKLVSRRPIQVTSEPPLISFTFDDFPRSALFVGGEILNRRGLAGTYYAAFGLAGRETSSGQIFEMVDLQHLVRQGHELGCHTFAHCHSWDTDAGAYEASVIHNRTALKEVLPDAEFKTFSYPYSAPRPASKRRVVRHFLSCRAGEQGINAGDTDLNQLDAFFLEKTRGNLQPVREIIDLNCRRGGWLIFATHDISDSPTPFGCTPSFFEQVVEYAAHSGARILPVSQGVEALGATNLHAL